ncbi:hypothetical protein XENTR_v10003495 [Xenopus tropicalis]|nr:hypothetical protein XENTR_v10003495 [Xenopus tropicalis]
MRLLLARAPVRVSRCDYKCAVWGISLANIFPLPFRPYIKSFWGHSRCKKNCNDVRTLNAPVVSSLLPETRANTFTGQIILRSVYK